MASGVSSSLYSESCVGVGSIGVATLGDDLPVSCRMPSQDYSYFILNLVTASGRSCRVACVWHSDARLRRRDHIFCYAPRRFASLLSQDLN
jgi:hypothetical protein